MIASIGFVFLILVLAATPSPASASITFPQDGSNVTYATFTTAQTRQGNITVSSTDSYVFEQMGAKWNWTEPQWNVTETITGKITCSPPEAQLSVRYRTTSDIMGAHSSVSNDPNIAIKVSYMLQDRVVQSTLIGSNVPAGYSAKCTLGGNDVASVFVDTPALHAFGSRYYVLFYVQAGTVNIGGSVPVTTVTSTILGTQYVTVLNTPRLAFVGAITGFTSGVLYWDVGSGILLLEQSTAGSQSDRMRLTYSTVPIPEFHLSEAVVIISTTFVLLAFPRNRKRFQTHDG